MPELPEVETIRRDLSKLILGKKIARVVLNKPKIVKSPTTQFIKVLAGNKIKKLGRRGKLLIAELDKGGWLLIHLKMTGQLIYQRGRVLVAGGHPEPPLPERWPWLPNKHTHVIFEFSNGGKLFFNDLRQFGYMKLADKRELDEVLDKYGIEPLTKDFALKAFQAIIRNRTTPIKAVLLNQEQISGLGNIYADEVCFLAGILPSRRAHRLTLAEVAKLYKACQSIIKKAVEKRGTTFRDYRDAAGGKGNYIKYLKVYGRGGEKCLKCKVSVLKKSRVAGRGTVYCVKCQK